MNRKEFLRSGLFLLLAAALLLGTSAILDRKLACNYTKGVYGFFNEPEQSMEVLFFGSSHMYCSMDPLAFKEETGLDSYVLATQQQPLAATRHYIAQSFEKQSPKLVVLELYMVMQQPEWVTEAVLRDCIDPLPWRNGKAELIKELVPEGQRGSYYFNLAKYHGRWREMSAQNFDFSYLRGSDADRGFIRFPLARPADCRQLSYEHVQAGAIIESNREELLRIKALVEEKGAQLCLLIAPYEGAEQDAAFFKAMHEFSREQGIALLDLNLEYDRAGFDGSTDFFDPNHLNAEGAKKATVLFARWAEENL